MRALAGGKVAGEESAAIAFTKPFKRIDKALYGLYRRLSTGYVHVAVSRQRLPVRSVGCRS